jgi:hypothetical protein
MKAFDATQNWARSYAVLTCGLLWLVGCSGGSEAPTAGETAHSRLTPTASPLTAVQIDRIERFCGDCHPMPIPDTFPKTSWPEEIEQGYSFYIDSQRTDLEEPIRQDVMRYFMDAAPDKVIVPRADEMPSEPSPIRFVASPGLGTGEESPVTAHLVWNSQSKSVVFTDMKGGSVREWIPPADGLGSGNLGQQRMIARGRNSCRVHLCDWNSDGIQDYLLGELGEFPVGDHEHGRVSLLLGQPNGDVTPIILADNLGRVVEAKPFDYDADGDNDVLVAEFGWRKTGALKLLRNTGGPPENPRMVTEVIDDRHGALGVEIADLNDDSKLDFVVAYGQEFETVEAYMNNGDGSFERQVLLSLPDPSYNSSAFQVVDVDLDGRLDVVHTCGDTMDALLPKPYHGVRVIRNIGDGQWENVELGLMVGALQAATADFDGDGDLDIAAVGLFTEAAADGPGAYDSICWWEQKPGFQFTRHSIERDHCRHAACAVADVNADGRVDLIVGEWLVENEDVAFRVFLNFPL